MKFILAFCCFLLPLIAFSQEKDVGLTYILQEEGLDGVMLFYDLKNDIQYTNDRFLTKKKVLPSNTFDALNTLILLKYFALKSTTDTLKWDGRIRKVKRKPVDEWNRNMTWEEGCRNNANWLLVNFSNVIEQKVYRGEIKESGFGKLLYRKKAGDFWNYGADFKVTLKNQIKFLVDLHLNALVYERSYLEMVKNMMIEKSTDDYILRGQVGFTENYECPACERRIYGIYSGYVETKDNVYFFSTRLIQPKENRMGRFLELRRELTYKGLKHLFGIDIE